MVHSAPDPAPLTAKTLYDETEKKEVLGGPCVSAVELGLPE
jgi:hypothetical protein